MQVKMLVPSNVVQLEPLARKASNWARISPRICPRTWARKNIAAPESRHIRSKPPTFVDQIRDGRPRQRRLAVDQRQMQPDRKPRQPARQFYGGCRRRRADHQACRCRDSFNMRALDGLDVWSRPLMGHSYRVIRRMRYGTDSTRERHNDRAAVFRVKRLEGATACDP